MSRREVPGSQKAHRRWSAKAMLVDSPMYIDEYDHNRTFYRSRTKGQEESERNVEGTVGTGNEGGYEYGYADNKRFCSGYAMDPHT